MQECGPRSLQAPTPPSFDVCGTILSSMRNRLRGGSVSASRMRQQKRRGVQNGYYILVRGTTRSTSFAGKDLNMPWGPPCVCAWIVMAPRGYKRPLNQPESRICPFNRSNLEAQTLLCKPRTTRSTVRKSRGQRRGHVVPWLPRPQIVWTEVCAKAQPLPSDSKVPGGLRHVIAPPHRRTVHRGVMSWPEMTLMSPGGQNS